jgi:hypothetical protein
MNLYEQFDDGHRWWREFKSIEDERERRRLFAEELPKHPPRVDLDAMEEGNRRYEMAREEREAAAERIGWTGAL